MYQNIRILWYGNDCLILNFVSNSIVYKIILYASAFLFDIDIQEYMIFLFAGKNLDSDKFWVYATTESDYKTHDNIKT